jgi:hypothetical protein
MREISTYISAARSAVIKQDTDGVFIVDMFENGEVKECRALQGKSQCYAEDTAENWILNII